MHRATVRALNMRSVVAVPCASRDRVFGVLGVVGQHAWTLRRDADVDLLTAVANNVALAVTGRRASRPSRISAAAWRTRSGSAPSSCRSANEELASAYRELQSTQMQLIQREEDGSVGQLVAGVAHAS